MSHFDRAITAVLNHEGGYVNNPADPGGETNYGICKRNYPTLDIRNLSRSAAILIYHQDYWREVYEKLPYTIAAKIFDMAVNLGHQQAHKLLQRAVGAVDDGVIGPKTLAQVAAMDETAVLNNLCEEQEEFYKLLIKNRPKSAVFMAGWLKRASWRPVNYA